MRSPVERAAVNDRSLQGTAPRVPIPRTPRPGRLRLRTPALPACGQSSRVPTEAGTATTATSGGGSDLSQVGGHGVSQERPALGIHWHDGPAIPRFTEHAQDGMASLLRVRGGSDNGQAGGRQQPLGQSPQARSSPAYGSKKVRDRARSANAASPSAQSSVPMQSNNASGFLIQSRSCPPSRSSAPSSNRRACRIERALFPASSCAHSTAVSITASAGTARLASPHSAAASVNRGRTCLEG